MRRKITTDNIRALLANLPESGAASSGSAEPGEDSQQLVIHELRILDSQLNLVCRGCHGAHCPDRYRDTRYRW